MIMTPPIDDGERNQTFSVSNRRHKPVEALPGRNNREQNILRTARRFCFSSHSLAVDLSGISAH